MTDDLESRYENVRRMAAQIRLLSKQLAARDAALDAVLNFCLNDPNMQCDSPSETRMRGRIVALLAKHGVHPK